MKTYFASYNDYIDSFLSNPQYRNYLEYAFLDFDFSKAFFKMVALDVDSLIPFLHPFYSDVGRPAKNQIPILRSLLLMPHFHCLKIKKWANRVKSNPALAILCGFDPNDIPSFPSYYDFINRFYDEVEPSHIFPKDKFPLDSKKKPKKNHKLENVPPNKCIDIYNSYKDNHIDKLPEDAFLQLFNTLALNFSINHNLLGSSPVIISGDGSACATHSNRFGTAIDDNLRRYSDIDADCGWDSDLGTYYFGYSEYNISTINHALKIDLPVFLTLAKASQHDSITAMTSLAKFQAINTRLPISYYCLDSASDNYPTHYLAYSLGIIPIIDINKRANGNNVYEPYKGISENGRPICQNNEEMISDGNDYTRYRHKFRCPHCHEDNNSCPLKDSCSTSPYGRTVYLKFDTDIKLFGPVPYKSDKWKDIYKDRTSCERINTRIINDYQFKDIRVHGRKRNLFFLIMIGINIHLDAYYKVSMK